MITFEQAREIVASHRAHLYPPAANFQVAPWGWENDQEYQLCCGAYAMVYPARNDADEAFIQDNDGPRVTVDKATGEYTEHYGSGNNGRPFWIADRTPIGVEQPAP